MYNRVEFKINEIGEKYCITYEEDLKVVLKHFKEGIELYRIDNIIYNEGNIYIANVVTCKQFDDKLCDLQDKINLLDDAIDNIDTMTENFLSVKICDTNIFRGLENIRIDMIKQRNRYENDFIEKEKCFEMNTNIQL